MGIVTPKIIRVPNGSRMYRWVTLTMKQTFLSVSGRLREKFALAEKSAQVDHYRC